VLAKITAWTGLNYYSITRRIRFFGVVAEYPWPLLVKAVNLEWVEMNAIQLDELCSATCLYDTRNVISATLDGFSISVEGVVMLSPNEDPKTATTHKDDLTTALPELPARWVCHLQRRGSAQQPTLWRLRTRPARACLLPSCFGRLQASSPRWPRPPAAHAAQVQQAAGTHPADVQMHERAAPRRRFNSM
jgi:hypothetical protein